MRKTFFILVPLCLILAPPARTEQRPDAQIDALIDQLTASDAEARQRAENSLAGLGEAARPKLVEASRSDTPAVAAAASRVLLSLPWYRPEDPAPVKEKLADYGASDDPGRIQKACEVAEMGRAATPAALRLILEEPNEDICWKIVSSYNGVHDAKVLAMMRKLDPPDTRPAALVLAAKGWFYVDRAKALPLLRRAIEAEDRRRTYDDGELDFAFEALADDAVVHHQYDEAARVRRLQASRIGVTRSTYPGPVFALFVLHAKYGPLAGLDEDARNYQQALGHPQALYALSHAYARAGRMLEALACEQTALASGLWAIERPRNSGNWSSDRAPMAAFLSTAGWDDQAEAEINTLLANDSPETLIPRINARLWLARRAGEVDDDQAAIDHLTAAKELAGLTGPLQRPGRNGIQIPFATNDLDTEIGWRNARLAHARGDDTAALHHLDAVLDKTELDPEVVMSVCPILDSLGRREQADVLFKPAYEASVQRLAADSDNPAQMNELAWLCARCGRQLNRAMDLATKAVAAEPDNSAFLDTLAEVNFHLGHADQSSKLEARALELEPGDTFMTRQLERFTAAAATQNSK
ncbi:MAG TPA: hypothetical protein VH518_06475 [Tepidisphaeraceae bacterium]